MPMPHDLEKKFPAFLNKYGGEQMKAMGMTKRIASATSALRPHNGGYENEYEQNRECFFSEYHDPDRRADPGDCLYQFHESVHGPGIQKSQGSGRSKSNWRRSLFTR